ncbi:MAG: DUF262 domain-containing protein [Aggregatibacter segnis]|uniref:DUF262 domain-containing protein n=1 Tax=Aggregatibacter segnis TaxID=739 RepID=UPI002593B0C7|nr:DUF262 domain-containing HNH endonuclease family protein [uncultured Aggregatibacter sp.]
MSKKNKYVKPLKINGLLDNDKYIIPIYQRNYAWEDKEISLLIQDLGNACQKSKENYYIGSLVVYKRENGDFEVIDGQQRLTTLTLIMHHLFKNGFTRNVYFEHRKNSDWALDHLELKDDIPSVFKKALDSIEKHWAIAVKAVAPKDLADFFLKKVEIIRTEVPKDTDLNHYFEIMNTRGEQLEKHEILKARLLEILPEGVHRSAFAQIWDACSDMSRYVVMGIESSLRTIIFSADWQDKPKLFDDIVSDYDNNAKNTQQSTNAASSKSSILTIIERKEQKVDQTVQNNEFTEGSFNSVIDFSNFLMHVLRIYLEKYHSTREFRDISLDEKELLNAFDKEWSKETDVIKFIDTLLSCRYLFDKYIIKSSTLRSEDEHWSLWKIVKGNSSSYYYKNTFGSDSGESNDIDADEQTKRAIMLLSMFHVSNPSRIYKNWLYAVLRWLFDNKDDIKQSDYIKFLEELCDKFYFGNNCQGEDITDIILGKEIDFSSNKEWNDGVFVPNFVFNRLDYQLWKEHKDRYPKFRFTFRSSVEHHYPQHPSEEHGLEKLDQKTLDNLGNLYLLSQSKNSRLSNLPPNAKKSYYPKGDYDSLKQAIMMSYDKWGEDEIKVHGEKMLTILNQPLSKTDS